MKTVIKPLREEAIRAGYEAMKDRLQIPFEAWEKALTTWEVQAFCDGEKVIGMLMTKGSELHVAILPEARGKWLSRRLIRETFRPLLERYGAAHTAVAKGNLKGDDFVSRLGFEKRESGYVKDLREGFASGAFDPLTAMVAGTAVAGGASLLGGKMQADAAKSAARTQADAANAATAEQARQFDINQANLQPFLDTATAGTRKLSDLMGLNGGDAMSSPLLRKFTSADLASDPVYNSGLQFGMDEGRKAIEARNIANGSGYDSSASLRQIVRYANDYGTTKANDAYNRFVNDQANIYGRLSGAAGGGQVASNLGSLGLASTNAITASQAAGANARAAGIVGGANAWGGAMGGVSNAAQNYGQMLMLKDLLSPGGGVSIGNPGGVTPIGAYGAS